jgi:choline dehydrogenase-like flavoprotein
MGSPGGLAAVSDVRGHDAVVVGSGAAGGWAAKALCEGGLEVLLLEAGRALDPSRDFPVPAPPERRLVSRAVGAIGGQRVQLRSAAFNARTRRFFVSDRANPYTTPPGSPFNWFRGRQVGGRLHLWARIALRLTDAELSGWPLSCAELGPYYDEVEEFLGVHEVQPTAAEERFRTAVEGVARVVALRVVAHDPERIPATIRAAHATGRLTLRPDAVVRRVTLAARGGRATGVEWIDRRTGEVHQARAGVVVLCAGTIETLRLLLCSEIGDTSGRLGHHIVDKVLTGLGGPHAAGGAPPAETDPYDLGWVTGFLVPGAGYGIQGGIGRGPSWYMLAQGGMVARSENRVTLDSRRVDAWGVPAAHIACAHAPADLEMARAQLDAMHELAARAGLSVRTPPSGRRLETLAFRLARKHLVGPSGAFLPGSAVHEVGGAAIGTEPESSVADPWGRLWHADNVVVADGAAFPAGCWQNVTLTIMALALRACRNVVREAGATRL